MTSRLTLQSIFDDNSPLFMKEIEWGKSLRLF